MYELQILGVGMLQNFYSWTVWGMGSWFGCHKVLLWFVLSLHSVFVAALGASSEGNNGF